MTCRSEYHWDLLQHIHESLDRKTPTREIEYPSEESPRSTLPYCEGSRTMAEHDAMADEAMDKWRGGECCGHVGECRGSWCQLAKGPCYRLASEAEVRRHWELLRDIDDVSISPYEMREMFEVFIQKLGELNESIY
jgi:hypothetical protein